MRFWLVIVSWVTVAAVSTPAAAEVNVDLRAADPVADLPVIAANKLNFLRAYRRWRPRCKRPDIFVEDGGIDASVSEPQYSSTPLIGGCGEAVDEFLGNVTAVNASMRKSRCATAVTRGQLVAKLPAHFEADGFVVDITGNATSAHVTINRFGRGGSWTGGRRMETEMAPFEVRGWYVVKQTPARRQLAVLIAGKQPDGTILERWMEVWATKAPAKLAPTDVARRWLLAFAARDMQTLTSMTALAFERAGLDSDQRESGCHDRRVARTAADRTAVLRCMSPTLPARYADLFDEQEFVKPPAKVPQELAEHAKRLTKLARTGHSVVVFSASDQAGDVYLAFAVKNGKVAAVFEALTSK